MKRILGKYFSMSPFASRVPQKSFLKVVFKMVYAVSHGASEE